MANTLPDVTAQLHSRYNPQAEAARYIEALNLDSSIKCFLLIEPGLGYLIPVLQRRYSGSKIIVLHAAEGFPACEDMSVLVPTWQPGGALSVQEFLEREIPDIDAARIRIIEWRPSQLVFGEEYVKLLSLAVECIKRTDAGYRTMSAFGRKWVKNFFRNLGFLRQAVLYRVMDVPVIVVGAGPGLETALPNIRQMRDSAFILAASSAVLALGHGGVIPDMVISTDGGCWALSHMYQCFRTTGLCGRTGAFRLAASLGAALPSQSGDMPLLILNDGSLWQNIVLKELGLPSVIIPQRGTVTASALELALILSTGGIFLAGMDLALRDIRIHARPYGFDHLFFGLSSRLLPVYSQSFIRSGCIQKGGSHDIYAAWFKNQLTLWPKRIFSLGGNHAVFENSLSPPQDRQRRKSNDDHFKVLPVGGGPAGDEVRPRLCEKGMDALIRALDDSRFAGNLNAELAPMLFPGEAEVANEKLKEAIADIAGRYGAPHG